MSETYDYIYKHLKEEISIPSSGEYMNSNILQKISEKKYVRLVYTVFFDHSRMIDYLVDTQDEDSRYFNEVDDLQYLDKYDHDSFTYFDNQDKYLILQGVNVVLEKVTEENFVYMEEIKVNIKFNNLLFENIGGSNWMVKFVGFFMANIIDGYFKIFKKESF